MADLSREALIVLRNATMSGWHVTTENLLDVADLLRAGLVRIEDDTDHIAVRRTEAGLQRAIGLELVERDEDGGLAWGIKGRELGSPWDTPRPAVEARHEQGTGWFRENPYG